MIVDQVPKFRVVLPEWSFCRVEAMGVWGLFKQDYRFSEANYNYTGEESLYWLPEWLLIWGELIRFFRQGSQTYILF